jgi:hypothetical protein
MEITNMSKTRGRLALVAGTLVILSVLGAGFAKAAPAPASASTGTALTVDEQPSNGERFPRLRQRIAEFGFGRFPRHLVHGTVTVLGRDGELVTLQFDHGTVAAIGDGSISISEANGQTVSVATSDETRVRKVRQASSLEELAVGDEVFVTSVVDDGMATARLIAVPMQRPESSESAS